MKKLSVLSLIIILGLVLVPMAGAARLQQAWPTDAGTSGVQVVNLATEEGTVVALYIAEDGTQYALPNQTLAGGASYTYYAQPDENASPAGPSSFRGAVQLSSEVQIAAIAKTEWGGGNSGAASYSGASAGAGTVLGPLVVVEHYGTSSAVTVQNTDLSNQITVDITFTPGGASSLATIQATIPAGASYTYEPAFGTDGFADPDTGSDAGWVGSVKVESTTPVVLAVHTTSQSGGFVYAYDGFTTLDQTVAYAPLVRRNFASLTTGVQVVDAGGSGGTVSVAYDGFADANGNFVEDAGEEYTCTDTATLDPGSSVTFYQGSPYFSADCGDTEMPQYFLGSAEVTATGTEVAVVVNDQTDPGAGGKQTASAYSGFYAAQGADEIISPLARHDYACFSTGIQIQNIGNDAVSVTATYQTSGQSPNTNTPSGGAARDLDPGQSTTYFIGLDQSSFSPDWLGSMSATATGSGEVSIVAITNDQNVNFGGSCISWGLNYNSDTALFNAIGQ